VDQPQKWERIRADLEAVIEGRVRVEELVRRRKQPSFMTSRPKPRQPNRVEIDNSVSDDYTVIDIFAHDRLGLLYHITRTLTELGLYIDVSKISTRVDQAADTFYVKDIFGVRVTREDKLAEIRQRLLACLDEEL
jgi:[protein-PII] uridylyltransferase